MLTSMQYKVFRLKNVNILIAIYILFYWKALSETIVESFVDMCTFARTDLTANKPLSAYENKLT